MDPTTRTFAGLAFCVSVASAVLAAACAQAPAMPHHAAHASLAPPPGAHFALSTSARGVQIYECRARAEGGFAWTFVAPEAELFDTAGRHLGHHGAGPFWQGQDGSRVTGSVKARADAPQAGAIPWLLLDAKATAAAGVFGGITAIQRVQTRGGSAPANGCDAQQAGRQARVDYTAIYHFYKGRA